MPPSRSLLQTFFQRLTAIVFSPGAGALPPASPERSLPTRKIQLQVKMEVFVKTSEGNGLHVAVPLKPGYGYEEVKRFTATMADTVTQSRPDLSTITRSLSGRTPGRVYFDHVRIGRGKTIADPYSVRPRDGAPVSTPLQWGELKKGIMPSDFHMGNTVERIARVGDLWAPLLKSRQSLPKGFLKDRGR